jgi:hypothetical protein
LNEVNFTYSVFGLLLRCNVSLPELSPALSSAAGAAVEIHMSISPYPGGEIPVGPEELTYTSLYTDEAGEAALRIWNVDGGAFLHLVYFDGAQFWMDRGGSEVWAQWPDSLTIEDAATYLLGPVLGLLLRLRGVTCLHASAIAIGDRAVAFVGSAGAGKSTTAAALAKKGYAVISDDVVALVEREGSFLVYPAYPYLCLWADSVAMVYGADKKLPSFSANWDKRLLSLANNQLRFQEQLLSLGAIFVLGQRSSESGAPFLEQPAPSDGLLSMVANSYATNLLDKQMRAREFELFGRLLEAVPIRRLRPHEDPARIDHLCGLILECYEGIRNQPLTQAASE